MKYTYFYSAQIQEGFASYIFDGVVYSNKLVTKQDELYEIKERLKDMFNEQNEDNFSIDSIKKIQLLAFNLLPKS